MLGEGLMKIWLGNSQARIEVSKKRASIRATATRAVNKGENLREMPLRIEIRRATKGRSSRKTPTADWRGLTRIGTPWHGLPDVGMSISFQWSRSMGTQRSRFQCYGRMARRQEFAVEVTRITIARRGSLPLVAARRRP
jgi:hypothetical protein